MICPDENLLAALGAGQVSGAQRERLWSHLDRCESCRHAAVAALSSTGSGTGPPDAWRSGGGGTIRIGRFEVVRRIGGGGMGEVFEARDVLLGRKVAIKVLRSPTGPLHLDDDARQRLLREAQLLARLNDPNVVAVYEAGVHEGEVYIAMELVMGQTLDRWVAAGPRTWREVATVMRAAAHGLGAAHAAGVIHRDVKPRNLIVSDGGETVKVIDFGLGRPEPGAVVLASPGPGSGAERSTTTRGILGTPAYSAPEQLVGSPADVRSDVFSLCATLYEALVGRRPYAGRTAEEICQAIRAAQRPPALSGRHPAALRRLLDRGLRADPSERPQCMGEVVALLTRALTARRRRGMAAAVVTAIACVPVVYGALLPREPAPCGEAATLVAEVWHATSRQAARAGILDAGTALGTPTWQRVEPALDAYADAWVRTRTQVCEATVVRKEQSAELLDRRMACLDVELVELEVTLAMLARADGAMVERAVDLVAALGDPSECTAPEAAFSRVALPVDPERRQAVEQASAAVARAEALVIAARLPEARDVASEAVRSTVALGYRPLEARAYYARAMAAWALGESADARAWFQQALWAAASAGDGAIEAKALAHLAAVDATHLGDLAAGRDWARHALAVADRLRTQPHAEADVRLAVADLLTWMGDLAGAAEELAAVELLLDREGAALASSDDLRSYYLSVAAAHAESSFDLPRSLELHREALALHEQVFGSNHPRVAHSLEQIGAVLIRLSRGAEARDPLQRAAEIRARLAGADATYHADYILALAEEDPAARLAFLERAYDAGVAELGARHPELAEILIVRGQTLSELGRDEEARRDIEAGLEILRTTFGPHSDKVRGFLPSLIVVQQNLGDLDGAIASAQLLVDAGQLENSTDPLSVFGRWMLGDLLAEQEDWPNACRHLRFAREHLSVFALVLDPEDNLLMDLAVTRCEWEEGDRTALARARELRDRLAQLVEQGGDAEYREGLGDIDRWLRRARAR